MKRRQTAVFAGAAALLTALVLFAGQTKAAAADALRLCGTTLIPSLFPFYAATNLMLSAGIPPLGTFAERWMRHFFHLPAEAAPAMLLGLLGGYPLGAAAAAELYRNGTLTQDEAVYLSGFANNAGPAFIIGAAGLAVFGSVGAGMLLYTIHAASAVITGILLRGNGNPVIKKRRSIPSKVRPATQLLTAGISSAAANMLSICAFVILFSVVSSLLFSFPPIRMLTDRCVPVLPAARALLSGVLELSGGILALRTVPSSDALIAASFLLGFGGICVFCQTASVLDAAGLPSGQCFRAKLIQGCVAASLAGIVCSFTAFRMTFLAVSFFFSCIIFLLVKIGGRKARHSLL